MAAPFLMEEFLTGGGGGAPGGGGVCVVWARTTTLALTSSELAYLTHDYHCVVDNPWDMRVNNAEFPHKIIKGE